MMHKVKMEFLRTSDQALGNDHDSSEVNHLDSNYEEDDGSGRKFLTSNKKSSEMTDSTMPHKKMLSKHITMRGMSDSDPESGLSTFRLSGKGIKSEGEGEGSEGGSSEESKVKHLGATKGQPKEDHKSESESYSDDYNVYVDGEEEKESLKIPKSKINKYNSVNDTVDINEIKFENENRHARLNVRMKYQDFFTDRWTLPDSSDKHDDIKAQFMKIWYMLRIKPEEAWEDIVKVGTIGLPDKFDYNDKKHFKCLYEKSQHEPIEQQTSIFSTNGKTFFTWNFNNEEVRQFRHMPFNRYCDNDADLHIRPRYINHVNSFDFMLNTLDIIFEIEGHKYFCQINVFEKAVNLEIKLERLTNYKYKSKESILKVKGILAYFVGDETLINFEHVYNCVIRQNSLEVESEEKASVNKLNKFNSLSRIYFWKKKSSHHELEEASSLTSENLDDFKDYVPSGKIPRITEEGNEIHNYLTGDLDEQFYITFRGWKDLFKVIEFAVEDNVEINNTVKAEMFFDNEETTNVNKGMLNMFPF
jgi:hypothetical protein